MEKLQILQARARALAQPPPTETVTAQVELAVLVLGNERYGIEIKYVQEIHPLSGSLRAHVPGAPPFWVGLVNLRGRLYPVLDLKAYLGTDAGASPSGMFHERKSEIPLPRGSPTYGISEIPVGYDVGLVLVQAAGLDVCLLVDEVLDIQRIAEGAIGTPLAEAVSMRREIVRGVTPELLTVLDLEALLSDPKLVVQDQVI